MCLAHDIMENLSDAVTKSRLETLRHQVIGEYCQMLEETSYLSTVYNTMAVQRYHTFLRGLSNTLRNFGRFTRYYNYLHGHGEL